MHRLMYNKLASPQSTRVLTLDRGTTGDVLRGRLETHSVGVNSSSTGYDALSYTWGAPHKTHRMICDGHDIPITQSLHGALSRLRLPNAPRRLWADQICINQDDAEELSSQVALMDMIYRHAEHVLVWLGDDDTQVARRASSLVGNLAAAFSGPDREAYLDRTKSSAAFKGETDWSPLRQLMNLPWYSRVWIVQEIGTTAPATLFWGDTAIDWEILHFVCKSLTEQHHLRKMERIAAPTVKHLYRRFTEPPKWTSGRANRFSFLYELHRGRHMIATDPRDKVFSLLGHFSIRQEPIVGLRELKADYSKSVEDVYLDLATRALSGADKYLLTLAAVQHEFTPKGQLNGVHTTPEDYATVASPNNLPSWVPDWRTLESHILSEPTSPHRASGFHEPELRVEGKMLHIRGRIVDTVGVCSESFPLGHFGVQLETDAHHDHRFSDDDKDNESSGTIAPQTTLTRIWQNVACSKIVSAKAGQHASPAAATFSPPVFDMDMRYKPALRVNNLIATPRDKDFRGDRKDNAKIDTRNHEIGNSALYAFLQTLSNGFTPIAWQDPDFQKLSYASVPAHRWFRYGLEYLLAVKLINHDDLASSRSTMHYYPKYSERQEESEGHLHQLLASKWARAADLATWNRVFGKTARNGYFVLGPRTMQPGDIICVLYGGRMLFCLRPLRTRRDNNTAVTIEEEDKTKTGQKNDEKRAYLLVGECYVHGLMQGEFMQGNQEDNVETEFKIV